MAWRDRKKSIAELERLKLHLGIELQKLEGVVHDLFIDWKKVSEAVPAHLAGSENAIRYAENEEYFGSVLNNVREVKTWLSLVQAEPNKMASHNPAAKNSSSH